MLSVSAVLIGLLVGYVLAFALGEVSLASVGSAAPFSLPDPLHFGLEFSVAAVIGFCLLGFVSAVETVGDVSGITKGGAGREATDTEIQGATFADGLGTALSGLFGALPNTSFSQNVGLIAMTGVMSRTVVTIGAVFLILCGLVPKIGAVISSVPIEVLGGGVIVMFGMVVAAGISMLSDVTWNRRNMVIFAIALSLGLGLQLEPAALQYLPGTMMVLATSGILPAAVIAIALNLILPQELADEATEEVSGGMAARGKSTTAPDRV
jgi:xanthine/uracil permease